MRIWNFLPIWSQISVRFALSLTVSETIFWSTKTLRKFSKMPAHRPICFGYMPKTNHIAGKAYQTSFYRKIEHLKPGSACPAPTKNEKKRPKFYLDRRQNVKGQLKCKKKFCILIPQDVMVSELNKIEGFSKCRCCCGCKSLNQVV